MQTATVTIAVTKQDIERGERGLGWACPVALAVEDSLTAKPHSVDVGLFCISYRDLESRTWIAVHPPEVKEWTNRFDNGLQVEPFMFTATFRCEEV
jgi:hypothetical protein